LQQLPVASEETPLAMTPRKPTFKVRRETWRDSEKQLQTFIHKFSRNHQALIRSVRQALRKRLPRANELVYDNYNFFVIGYSSSECPSDTIVSLAAGANGVGLSFPYCGATLPDPHKLLLGSGHQNRFIRLDSTEDTGSSRGRGPHLRRRGPGRNPFASDWKRITDPQVGVGEAETAPQVRGSGVGCRTPYSLARRASLPVHGWLAVGDFFNSPAGSPGWYDP
jgi:hypothetical protein